ncbi:hypothetical protein [Paenibacillus marinisediminis]
MMDDDIPIHVKQGIVFNHYQSVHSFSKAFKKTAGITPSEYQDLYGNAAEKRWL